MNIEKILPSIGFIGCGPTSCLQVCIKTEKRVEHIKLALESNKKVDLSLKKIKFFDENGKLIKLTENDVVCTQSTWRLGNKKSSFNLIKGTSISTEKEFNPYWEIIFKKPLFVSNIIIENRKSKYSLRTKTLKIKIKHENSSEFNVIYNNMALDRVNDFLNLLKDLEIKYEINGELSDEDQRLLLIKKIINGLVSNVDKFKDINLKAANYLLNLSKPSGVFLESEIDLLSLILIRDHKARYAIKNYSNLLFNKAALNYCQKKISEYGNRIYGAEFILTKHGLSRNVLHENAEGFIKFAKMLSSDLQELGYQNLLCYGTLLGAVRDNDFIKNDDDLDMLYLTEAKNQGEILTYVNKVKSELEKIGYRCSIRDTNMHVTHPSTNAKLDIFPSWINGNKLYLHMEHMKYRFIEKDIILPLGRMKFKGEEFNIPNNCEKFFIERYHNGWDVYDPYHEWPWTLLG